MQQPFFVSIMMHILFLVIGGAAALTIGSAPLNNANRLQLSLGGFSDCSNNTHRWNSLNASCFDEASGPIPYSPLYSTSNILAGYISSFVRLHPRDGLCGPEETTCWVVNCCQLGETCGPINVGCQVSWSTIYTTTITTLWSTVTSWSLPRTTGAVDYTTVTVNTTTFATSFNQITLPGEGLDQIIATDVVMESTLVLSAYTPPTVTTTETVTRYDAQLQVTPPARLMIRDGGRLLPRVEIPRRSAGTSYTTLTVFVTTFFTTSTTATLSNSIVELTTTLTISSIATRNQTHYKTPTGFTTSTVTVTSTSSSYAYGTVDTPTQVYYVTTMPSPVIAGTTPTTGVEESNPVASQTAGATTARSRKLSSGAIAGLVVGIFLALVLIGILIGIVFSRRQKRKRAAAAAAERDEFDETPSPPPAPSPKPGMTSISQTEITIPDRLGGGDSPPVSPMSELFFSGLNMIDDNKYNQMSPNGVVSSSSSRHSRRGSRGSAISAILPVPEEEDEDAIRPVNSAGGGGSPFNNNNNRSSIDSRNWGRGYGGRGGYYNVANGRSTRSGIARGNGGLETESPQNPAFSGVITSAYSEGGLVPPHARDHGFRF
ncbi:hypothetical protein ABW20_dc0108471 [Dactylellina cionopaga]|nr:hypothetical protein ABW20_dc0108471 [Dactylellina cionopaga]